MASDQEYSNSQEWVEAPEYTPSLLKNQSHYSEMDAHPPSYMILHITSSKDNSAERVFLQKKKRYKWVGEVNFTYVHNKKIILRIGAHYLKSYLFHLIQFFFGKGGGEGGRRQFFADQ